MNNKILIGAAVAIALIGGGFKMNIDRKARLAQEAEQARMERAEQQVLEQEATAANEVERERLKPLAAAIVERIESETQFTNFYQQWGGKPSLFIPQAAWAGLSEEEKQTLKDHAAAERLGAIYIGAQQGDVIGVDLTVWESD